MTPASRKVVFLAGAPTVDALDWDEHRLTSAFMPSTLRFLGEQPTPDRTDAETQPSHPLAKWRALPMKDSDRNARSATPESFSSVQDGRNDEHVNFLEHSLAILQDLESSQIEVPGRGASQADDTTSRTALESDSVATLSTSLSISTSTSSPEQQVLSFAGPITDLAHLPTARRLQAIHPQTITLNFLAGIIALQPARTVRLRSRPVEREVIEVLVGDETQAGFSITFWLEPLPSAAAAASQPHATLRQGGGGGGGADLGGLRAALSALRPGAVVLLTHVALSEFQGAVSGQSLSRRITRNNTGVTPVSAAVMGLSPPVAAKHARVREWAERFVGGATREGRASAPREAGSDGGRRRGASVDCLPDDTQY